MRLLAAAVLAVAAGPAAAQRFPVEVTDAKVGLPPGRSADGGMEGHVVKRDTWAPVYLTLKVHGEKLGRAKAVVEAEDADGLRTAIDYPLGSLADRKPGEVVPAGELPFVPCVRPGGTGEVAVTVHSDDPGERPRPLSEPFKLAYLAPRGPNSYVVLGLGSRLPGLDPPAGDRPAADAGGAGLRRVDVAAVTDVRQLPDQWVGYAGCDLAVLATGSAADAFLDELFDAQRSAPFAARREALLEWVRRGGRLVVSAAAQAARLNQHEAFRGLLPAPLDADRPARPRDQLGLQWKGFGTAVFSQALLRPRAGDLVVAAVRPDPARPVRVLVPPPADGPAPADRPDPVVVQAAYGLGRVTFVAFDLDRSPFADSPDRLKFWDWLVRAGGHDRATAADPGPGGPGFAASDPAAGDELAALLRGHMDTFEGVPVISFGWVALFIVLYTLLIGPVEYLFLKKVVGRLELTWVTFPLIVLGVSAAAYFAAYAVKGKDLRLNKVDVVDVDLAGGRVSGRAWLTLFSPRIDSYTIGLEPRPGWGPAGPGGPPRLVDWMAGGAGGGNIVSRGYRYHTAPADGRFADALVGVPIQVWSTKGFTADWAVPLDPASPLVDNALAHPPGDPAAVTGSATFRLPVGDLKDPVLMYAGRAYAVGRAAGQPGVLGFGQTVTPVLDKAAEETGWFAQVSADLAAVANSRQYGLRFGPAGGGRVGPAWDGGPVGSGVSLWGALFHDRAVGPTGGRVNGSLRRLDQSWRVSDRPDEAYRDQAILVGKASAAGVSAEAAMTAADGPSPTVVWLDAVPGGGADRTPIPGTLRQETYVRVFLPIRPAPGAGR